MPQFDGQSAKRISNAVRGWERRLKGRQQTRARWHGKQNQRIFTCVLTADLNSGSSATATLLIGETKATSSDTITVYDLPTFITSGYKIASGVKLRVFKDPDTLNKYCLLVPAACEVAQ